MRKIILPIVLLSLLIPNSAFAGEAITRTIKNCVNIKTGDARLISEKVLKCGKGEKLSTIVIPDFEADSHIHIGPIVPLDFITGHDGDFFINSTTKTIYGPRIAGIWGPGVSMVGEIGPIGRTGAALLSGVNPPDSLAGYIGDFYLDVTSKIIYGPKSERSGWGVGTSIAGPQGVSGPQGPQGLQGAPGGFGAYGSFYDTTTVALDLAVATAIPLGVTSLSNGVSISEGSKITFETSGKFNLAFSTQLLKEDNGTDTVSIWLCKGSNGGTCSNVPWTNTNLYLVGADARYVAAWNFFLDVRNGDYYQLMISSSGATLRTKILSAPAQSSPNRPEVPGTILTVNQVG